MSQVSPVTAAPAVKAALTLQDVARAVGLSYGTMRNLRARGGGPKAFYPTGSIRTPRFRPEEVEKWMIARSRGGASV
ncbi:helix-turn-helix transcriptional regulator [Gordonia sp. 852002-51296_SCH5728562-b]|uniref:helix-turn-helix transcriptional regulator n=1 Tax=Gordonia sp. 852002-51296_SCH5728562-b TaxID=1834101 RepID=UPI0007EB6CDB|nr:helix-turn-helix domain-containing protein [Gordonia sp. 852002-51296_SCH5728562-b]OBA30274.1 hypothetical protein A5766_15930 [Gordonia sp. 852002-51296_SCH5728562-b]